MSKILLSVGLQKSYFFYCNKVLTFNKESGPQKKFSFPFKKVNAAELISNSKFLLFLF